MIINISLNRGNYTQKYLTKNKMKKLFNTELKINSTQPKSVQESKHLFREVEKRYNITINDEVLIGIHHEVRDGGIIDYTIEDVFSVEEDLDKVNIGNIPLTSFNEIYKLTGSGYYSNENPFNIVFSNERTHIVLIPIITISRGSRSISFWIDDKFFRDLFYNTELIMNGDRSSLNRTTEEIEEELKKEYKKQLNRLNKLFNK